MKPTTTEPIAREGFWYVGCAFALVILSFYYDFGLFGKTFAFSAFAFAILFFRNPERIADSDEDVIMSPCDGRVVSVDREFDSKFFNDEAIVIVIRNKALDTHFVRSIFRGSLTASYFERGSFLPISSEKSGLLNERAVIEFASHNGEKAYFSLMAGSLPSSIKPYKTGGSKLRVGERLIFLRSEFRLALYLPKDTTVQIGVGDRVYGGKTVIGELDT
jgi:phosphatidylserine decarboxylase